MRKIRSEKILKNKNLKKLSIANEINYLLIILTTEITRAKPSYSVLHKMSGTKHLMWFPSDQACVPNHRAQNNLLILPKMTLLPSTPLADCLLFINSLLSVPIQNVTACSLRFRVLLSIHNACSCPPRPQLLLSFIGFFFFPSVSIRLSPLP